jgi:hypothetical protein
MAATGAASLCATETGAVLAVSGDRSLRYRRCAQTRREGQRQKKSLHFIRLQDRHQNRLKGVNSGNVFRQ